MSQEWMIDVLTDLRTFAKRNGLLALAEQLDDSIHVAVTELKAKEQELVSSRGEANADHSVHRTFAAGDNL